METQIDFGESSPDILFVVPPVLRFLGQSSTSFPLGLGYMVSYLKIHGITSLIYNPDTCQINNKSTAQNYIVFMKNSIFFKVVHKSFRFILKVFRFTLKIFIKKRTLGFNTSFAESWPLYYSTVNDSNIWNEVKSVLKKMDPKIVGISSKVVDIPSTFILADIIKQILPDAKVIVGGPSATTCSDYLMKCNSIDILVLGEGEKTIVELTKYLLKNTEIQSLDKINGIAYRKIENNTIIYTPPRSLINDIDEIPIPDRESMFFVDAKGKLQKMNSFADILTSRGCPYLCTFCCAYVVWGTRKPRIRSVDNVVKEIISLKTRFNQNFFIFWDDMFTFDRERTIELCKRIIEEKINITWLCLLRINTIDAKLLDIMKKAGCVEIQTGIESGSDRILKLIKKGITINMIKRKALIIRKSGIKWRIFLIIGFPTETRIEIDQTINLVNEIKPDYVDISMFCPYPGTALHKELRDNGLLGKDFMKSDMWYPYITYTGTMSNEEFKEIAFNALRYVDKYNSK